MTLLLATPNRQSSPESSHVSAGIKPNDFKATVAAIALECFLLGDGSVGWYATFSTITFIINILPNGAPVSETTAYSGIPILHFEQCSANAETGCFPGREQQVQV